MSFILDALKKSEHERQRQSMPGLVEATVVRPRQRLPGWAIALCVLLAVNLLVLLVVLLRGWMSGAAPRNAQVAATAARAMPPAAAATDADSRTESPPAADDRHFSPLDNSAQYAPEVPVTNPVVPTPPPARAATAGGGAIGAGGSAERGVRRRDPLLSEDNYKSNEDEVLPSINELNLTGAQALPELHLDVHVFATRAADRFVFINMRKYHEGATMQEGPSVERIRRDGVILDYQGLRFLLPRQ